MQREALYVADLVENSRSVRGYPEVAWRHIRAFRNLAVHKYFSVDWAVVWQIAQEEVPVLEQQAMGVLRAEFPDLARTYEPDAAHAPPMQRAQSRGSILTEAAQIGANCTAMVATLALPGGRAESAGR